jgi:hypothetical protein
MLKPKAVKAVDALMVYVVFGSYILSCVGAGVSRDRD